MIVLRSQREIEKIRKACLIVAEILKRLREHVQPGVTTWDLNALSEELATKQKAKPAFKGYHGYPFALCTSVNEEVVHGMPSKQRRSAGRRHHQPRFWGGRGRLLRGCGHHRSGREGQRRSPGAVPRDRGRSYTKGSARFTRRTGFRISLMRFSNMLKHEDFRW